MSLATVSSEQAWPRASSAAATRGLPYRPRTSAWTSPMRAASPARRVAAALGDRLARA